MSQQQLNAQVSVVEVVKQNSHLLRGTIRQSLSDPLTGAIAEDDTHIAKFHGVYQQDDRDIRSERHRQKLEPAYAFMIRARVVAGRFSSAQWLQLDALVRRYANATLRLTTRQTFQLHGVLKKDLKACVQAINALSVDTLAACGDVNRNVMCSPMREDNELYRQTWQLAVAVSQRLTPRTRAYAEIWLNVAPRKNAVEEEPLYGPSYLPRKFKIGFAIPPHNDVDVFTHDLGFIAIQGDGVLQGFNVAVGGGMGKTHSDDSTYPRLGSVIGFCTPDQVVALTAGVVAIQRDHGDRLERKHARLKYTIDRKGLDWFCTELKQRTGLVLGAARPYHFATNGDVIGWRRTSATATPGTAASDTNTHRPWHLTLFVAGGRIRDREGLSLLSCLRDIAEIHPGDILFTPNHNLIISAIAPSNREPIEALLQRHGVAVAQQAGATEQRAMACVAFPTCGLAMAEAERYLPDFIDSFTALLKKYDLEQESPSIRITGCPNGCARPYVAEVALIGKALGHYNLMLGGSPRGDRLNRLYRENLTTAEILSTLDDLLAQYSLKREAQESFGDYFDRTDGQSRIALQERD